ncbi:MAG: NYN domain-containing protein [Proteobacteria bacterium]|nr:NYN domain-containing protein [Pseudomonadota bacterium]
MKKVAVLIDAGFMKKRIIKTGAFYYDAKHIVEYCHRHANPAENKELYRIFFYDATPSKANGHNPISKTHIDFSNSQVSRLQEQLFNDLKLQEFVALRLGSLEWPGNSWQFKAGVTKDLIKGKRTLASLTDQDLSPTFTQKGVDMRIGLDIASLAYKRLVQSIVVITADRDFIPALKLARKEGLAVGLDTMKQTPSLELHEHVDFVKTFIP